MNKIFDSLKYSNNVIISPDFDGLLSAAIINKYKNINISGIYTTNRLFMLDNIDPKECLWIDHDIRQKDIVSIGCHAVYPNIEVNPLSYNPHREYNQHPDNCFKGIYSKARDKFPFSTSVLLAHYYEWYPEDMMSLMMLSHADSGHKVYNQYRNNVEAWADVFSDRNVDLIIKTSPEPIFESLKSAGYKDGSFQKSAINISSPTNYINNIRKMRNFIHNHLAMPEINDIVETHSQFKIAEHKFSGGVEEHTLDLVNNSFSYAVIFKNHISYTMGSL